MATEKTDKQWTRSDGVIIDDEGANYVPNRFDGEARASAHFESHSDEYIKTLFKPTNTATYYHNQKKVLWKLRKGK